MADRISLIIVIATQMTQEELKMIRGNKYRIAFLNQTINEKDMKFYDLPFEINLNNEEEVFELIKNWKKKFKIERIITFNEYYIGLAAKICERHGIPNLGLSAEAAMNCRFKEKAKKLFLNHGVETAEFTVIKDFRQVLDVLGNFQFPVVVKPSNDAGSHHVTICKTLQEVIESAKGIYRAKNNYIGQKLDHSILIEAYLEGPEYSVETITINGKSHVIAITEKETWGTVEVAHTVPAGLSIQDKEDIENLVLRALEVLKINNSITHTEVKLTHEGPKIVEVNGRIGGDKIHKLVKIVTGVDLRKTAIHIHMNGNKAKIYKGEIEAPSATVYYFTAKERGTFLQEEVKITDAFVKEIDMFVEHGQEVVKTDCNLNRLGYFIVKGTRDKSSRELVEEMLPLFNYQIKMLG